MRLSLNRWVQSILLTCRGLKEYPGDLISSTGVLGLVLLIIVIPKYPRKTAGKGLV